MTVTKVLFGSHTFTKVNQIKLPFKKFFLKSVIELKLWKIIATLIHQVIISLCLKNYVEKSYPDVVKKTIIVEQMKLIHCCWRCKLVWTPLKTDWQYLVKPNVCAPYEPAIPLLETHPRELSACPPKHIYKLFLVALFIVA